jgi:hypothetical protein
MKVPDKRWFERVRRKGFNLKMYEFRGVPQEVTFTKKIEHGVSGLSYLIGDGWTARQMVLIGEKARRVYGKLRK